MRCLPVFSVRAGLIPATRERLLLAETGQLRDRSAINLDATIADWRPPPPLEYAIDVRIYITLLSSLVSTLQILRIVAQGRESPTTHELSSNAMH